MSKPSTGKIDRLVLEPDTPLTPEEQAQLAKLAATDDDNIDLSDISESRDDTGWTHPGIPAVENKQQITLRLDADVLDYFRGTGKRYQTRINSVLRTYVKAHRKGGDGANA